MRQLITKTTTKYCEYCNKPFTVRNIKCEMKKKYCCKHCSAVANAKKNLGKPHTEETKRKISQSNLGEKNHFFGKTHSEETKRKISIKNKWEEQDFNHCAFSLEEYEIINGLLLADGHLEKSIHSSRLSYGSKFKETLEDIQNVLKCFSFGPLWQSKKSLCWHFKSKYYKELLFEHDKWYENKIKRVPKDIKLTPITLYWWFIGDGYRRHYSAVFCTDAFSQEDKILLIKKFNEIGFFDVHITKNGKRIYIGSSELLKFLKLIMDNNTISKQYEYKFSLTKWRINNDYNQ